METILTGLLMYAYGLGVCLCMQGGLSYLRVRVRECMRVRKCVRECVCVCVCEHMSVSA